MSYYLKWLSSIFIAFMTFFNVDSCSLGDSSTTIFLVRHADRIEKQDALSPAGIQRAKDLNVRLKDEKLDVIFSSDYNRTKGTGQFLSDELSMPMTIYDASDIPALVQDIKMNYRGKRILVIGHSNTTPDAINAFGWTPVLEHLDHYSYDNLFKLTLAENDELELEKLKYGK